MTPTHPVVTEPALPNDDPNATLDQLLPPPANIYEAIRRVMIDLGGIPKMTGEQHKKRHGVTDSDDGAGRIKYAYRSIDQITGDAQPLFGKYGCVWVPKVIECTTSEPFTLGNGNSKFVDVRMTVNYWVVGPGGAKTVFPNKVVTVDDGSGATHTTEEIDLDRWYLTGDVMLVGPLYAVGRDNADKGNNKAMTQALKQALLQVLSIGDPADEGDNRRDEGQPDTSSSYPVPEWKSGPENIANLKRQIEGLSDDRKAALKEEWKTAWEGGPMVAVDNLGPAGYAVAARLVHAHVLDQHRESGAEGEEPPPPTGDAFNLTPDALPPPEEDDPDAEALAAARVELGHLILQVPNDGTMGRDILRSNLRGQFGDALEITDMATMQQAIAVAEAWPEPPPPASVPTESPDSAPVAATAPETGEEVPPTGDGQNEPLVDVLTWAPGEVTDAIEAEIGHMKMPELKDELRKVGEPVSGNLDTLRDRVFSLRVLTWAAANAPAPGASPTDGVA